MVKTRKEEKQFIQTELGRKLYDYNNETTPGGLDDIQEFIRINSNKRNEGQSQDLEHMGGVNPLGSYIDFTPTSYDGTGLYEHQLSNAEDFREQNQGILSTLGNATANFIGKTAVNVVGGLAGTVYGGAEALASGDITKLWDNEFTTALDKASDSIGDYFKVYNSNDYNERSLISRALLNPVQFTDELMDTLSFTAGAVITELISGGMASAFVAPRAIKYLKGLNLMSDAGEIGARMGGGSNRLLRGLGNAGNLTRQLATGAAYEAAVEARHGGFELRDRLYDEWLEENPGLTIEDMPQSVKDDIDDRLSSAGLFTFLTNMALVGGSNIVQFPKVFGAGYNTSKRASDIAENIGKNSDGTFFNSLSPISRAERVASNVSTALKNPIMEGLVEEGGQSVISGTANDFFARKYDLDSQDTVNEFITSFGKNLIDTYTTAEGWEEIGMGMIVGSLGAPGRGALSLFGKNTRLGKYGYNEDGTRREVWDGGIAGSFNQRRDLINEIDKYVNDLNQNTSLGEAMKANYDFLVQSDSLEKSMNEALKNNDVFNFNNFRDDKIHAYISSRLKAGLSSDLDTTIDQLERMSPEDMYIEFRGQDEFNKASERDIRNFKESSIKEFKDKVNATKEAYSIVDNAYNGDNPDLRDYFAHSIAAAKYLDIREKLINQSLSDLTNGYINNLNVRGSNSISINQEIDRLNSLLKEEESLSKEEKEDISNVINSYKNISDKNKKLSVDEYQALYNMQSVDPVTLNLNINKITELLDDSRKLRERRQSFIKNYNDVFTEEGHKRALKRQRDLLKKEEEDRLAKEAEEARIKAEQDRIKEEERVKSRKAEIKAKKEAAQVKKNELASKDQFEQTEEDTDDIESLLNIKEAPLTNPDQIIEEPSLIDQYRSRLKDLESDLLNANTPDERKNIQSDIDRIRDIIDKAERGTEEIIGERIDEEETLTPEEEAVITNIEQEEVYEENKLLNQDGLVRNPSQEDKNSKRQIYLQDNWFKRDVGNTIISLNIDYNKYYTFINGNLETDISDIIDDEGRVKINENFDSRLQDPNQFNKDTAVNVIIPTYQQILDKGIGGEGYSESDYNKYIGDVDMFPIAFTDNDGNIIGYLPTQANVKNNVNPEYLKTELIKNKELRQQIFDNRDSDITATITNKSSGTPIFQRYNQSIYNALGDGSRLADGVSIGIFKEGKLQTGINNPYQGDIKLPDGVSNDEYFNEGYIYAIIPTAKEGEHFAINIDVNTISESDANSIIKILELYKANPKFAGDANLVNERESLSVEVDFNNIKEVNRALESILYINNDNDNYMFRIDSDKLILGLTPDMQFTWKDFRKQATKDKIKDILSKRYYAVRLANFGNPFNSYSVSENGQLDVIRNRNYFDYLNNNNIIQSNLQSEPISNKANERYFTAQSVIEIGNVKIEPKQLEPSKTRTVEEINNDRNIELEQAEKAWSENVDERGFPREALPPILKEINDRYDAELAKASDPEITLDSRPSVSATEEKEVPKKPKTRLGLKIKPNRNKPNIEEDLAEISNPNLSLDKEAELLMKKCSK